MRKRIFSIALFVVAVGGLWFFGHYTHELTPTISSQQPAPIAAAPAYFSLADVMRLVLSIILTIASLVVILWKGYGPKDKHWAYATIGTILGFWLNSSK
jgi:hypothetical protein